MSEGTFRSPKVIEIDCDKWWRIIGITLWTFGSFGIYYGEYNMVKWAVTDTFTISIVGDNQFGYDNNGNQILKCKSWCVWSPLDIIGLIFGTGATLFNTIGIWIAINNHFRLIQVRCKN